MFKSRVVVLWMPVWSVLLHVLRTWWHVHWSVHAWANFFHCAIIENGKGGVWEARRGFAYWAFRQDPIPINWKYPLGPNGILSNADTWPFSFARWMLPIDLEHGTWTQCEDRIWAGWAQCPETLGDSWWFSTGTNDPKSWFCVCGRKWPPCHFQQGSIDKRKLINGREGCWWCDPKQDELFGSGKVCVSRFVASHVLLKKCTYFYNLFIDIHWNHVSSM